MGKRSGKRAKASAKIKDLRARTKARRAAQVKGGAQVAEQATFSYGKI